MKCDLCEKDATVHVSVVQNGTVHDAHLCAACAAQNTASPVTVETAQDTPEETGERNVEASEWAGEFIPDATIYVPEVQLPEADADYGRLIAAASRNRANWKPPKGNRPYILMSLISIPMCVIGGLGALYLLVEEGNLSYECILVAIFGSVLTLAAFSKY